MENIIDSRNVLQFITLVLSVLELVLIMLVIHKKILNWRYLVLPVAILIQIVVFYSYVLIASPEPSEAVTFWSGIIRFQAVAGLLVVLLLLYRERS